MNSTWRMRIRQDLKMAAQNLVLPLWYRIFSFRKVEEGSVLFADAHHDSRPANMDLLYAAMKKEKRYHIREMYLDYGKASFVSTLLFSLRFMRMYAGTQTVILCDNFLPAASCRCRKETLVVQLWHACGCLKKFGYDTEADIPSSYHGHVFRNTQLVTVSAPVCIRPFASAMRLDSSCIQATGISRTDLYFRKKWIRAMQEKFESLYPEAQGKRIVVAAPTFRGNPGAPDAFSLDTEKLERSLGPEYFVLVSLHPHMKKTASSHMRISKMSTSELFPVTDVLISDYSSLIYEYLLFQKPLVLYVPDRESYEESRGFYMDISEIPACIAAGEDDLAPQIAYAYNLYHSDEEDVPQGDDMQREKELLEKKRMEFLERYMISCDGHSTRRILDEIDERTVNKI